MQKKTTKMFFLILFLFLFIGNVEAKNYEDSREYRSGSSQLNQLIYDSSVTLTVSAKKVAFKDSDSKTNQGAKGCDILGGVDSETVQILSTVVKIVRLGVPILIIILGVIDFMKILFSGEEKVFKESFNRFIKRLGIGVIIIFLPYILQFLVALSGVESQYGIDNFFCGIIDASGAGTSRKPASSYKNSDGCDNAGYIWNSVKSVCVNGNGNTISASDCKDSGYKVVSDGNVPGGFRCVQSK